MNNFLSQFPPYKTLKNKIEELDLPQYRETNLHIHTPYSYSSFPDMGTIFQMATDENISALGINDFFVADGYDAFLKGCLKNRIFPFFNIEFTGLLREEQEKGIRINDPNNPGRIYFSGKGLDYPFHTGWLQREQIRKVVKASQKQIRSMISGLNEMINKSYPSLSLDYEMIKKRYAHSLVRERHIAKALRIITHEEFPEPEKQLLFLESLYGNKRSETNLSDTSFLENEIRTNILKKGGTAFVEEDERSFPDLQKIIKIIIKAGGIPCYPVLLDNPSGDYTEYEKDPEKLHHSLHKLKVGCIELIPGRNDITTLSDFVRFFHKKGYIIVFGTEHNTPVMTPLTVSARGTARLDDSLKKIAWEGACIIAAHQYLRAKGRQGYVLPDGSNSVNQKDQLVRLGQYVIEYFINYYNHESADK